MELGVFSLTELSRGATVSDRVRDIIDFGIHADEVGLDVYGIGEHHTPRFSVSSPAVVLGAIASRTSSITLTSTVSVLSILDPVRLFQDFAQLDTVSGGRAEITAGRSAYREPFDIFGVPMDKYDAVFEEKLDLLLALRQNREVTWAGRFRPPLDHVALVPQLDRPLPLRLGVGGTPASAARAGRLGLPMTLAFLHGTPAQLLPAVGLYRQAGEQHGHDPAELAVGIVSHMFIGPTSHEARDTFYPHYRTYVADGRGIQLDRETFDEMAGPDGPLVVGSAHEVADKLLRLDGTLGLDRFMGQVDIGALPREAVLASMDRLAADVLPAVQRQARNSTTN
ncbi:LLM class flavin-dependent oxidoreductase [Glaciihabitans sp. dw_435]|uniref:LLM class flavin-dependent oxidoreductase n=1 Tax=Glaciihabitans sp. dw_435 TaxID=2720081 RepID=UPI001BD4D5E0|nr:LLM class flavin-dependent oxidoreductase [Glaciihabitans sp. dw_435]